MSERSYNLTVDLHHTCGYDGEACVRVTPGGAPMPVLCPGCTEVVTRVAVEEHEDELEIDVSSRPPPRPRRSG